MPELFVVAGPNGAGKSLFSNTLIDIDMPVFDGDKIVDDLKKQFPEIGSETLEARVNEHNFSLAKEKAISGSKSFAFETNFSAGDPLFSLQQFKASGYSAHLIFIGMNSVEDSIQRVLQRVQEGGHKVSEASIRFNFEKGLENLTRCYYAFDTVTLIDNPIRFENGIHLPHKILSWENGVIKVFDVQLPDWARRFQSVTETKAITNQVGTPNADLTNQVVRRTLSRSSGICKPASARHKSFRRR